MPRNDFGYFFPLVLGLGGELALLITLLVTRYPVFLAITLRDDIILVRAIALLAGIGMLFPILAKFSTKYRQNPTRTRLVVLLALISFVPCAVLYFIVTTWRFNDAPGTVYQVSRFFIDGTILFLMASVYCFVLFGLDILLFPGIERPVRRLKIITDITFASILLVFYIMTFAQVFPGMIPPLASLANLPFYLIAAVGLYYLVILFIMVIKSFELAKKASERDHRVALDALGITFLILITCIVLLMLNFIAFDSSKEIIVVCILLVVISFLFIYQGFVRPTSRPKGGEAGPAH
nr:hypothetical protein [Candidatus Sigynarchaeota archaeon]